MTGETYLNGGNGSYAMMLIMDWKLRSYKGGNGYVHEHCWDSRLGRSDGYRTCIAQVGMSFVNRFLRGHSTGF
jgi:hypothetical protein